MNEIMKHGGSGGVEQGRPGSGLSRRDDLPELAFSGGGHHQGPVLLDIDGKVDAVVRVGSAQHATVRVYTHSTEPSVLEAVRNTVLEQTGTTLRVTVPQYRIPPTVIRGGIGSHTIISGGSVVIQSGSGTVIGGGDSLVKVEVTLPADSGIRVDLESGTLRVDGDLVGIEGEMTSGEIRVNGSVGKARVRLSSGALSLASVTEGIDIAATSGNVAVGRYTGSHAELRCSSGNLALNVGREATGSVSVRISSGNATLSGVHGRSLEEGGNLSITTRCSSGHIRRR